MRGRTILLIDDNPDDVELTLRAFERCRVANQIVVMEDGEKALDYLHCAGPYAERVPDLPEVVLLDLNLPRIDGHEVLRRIRADERTRRLPVVILTSSQEARDLVLAYDRGANSFVRKPVAFEEFVESARQLGLYWLVLNQVPPANPASETR
ncbi:MAG: two-component system response regulator [Myxococcales bacterium]